MTGLYDRDILEASLSACAVDPSLIAALLAANGGELVDFGDIRPLYGLARHLADLHTRGEMFDREIAASRIAETTGAERGDVDAIMRSIEGRGNPAAFQLWLDKLRSLRFRRRLVDAGEHAQNGCADADLVAAVQLAVREGETGNDGLVFADLTAPPLPTPPALVGRPGCTLIPVRQKTGVVGDSGAGKTHLFVSLALGIASGCDVLDMACAQQPVLYCTSDDDPDMERKFQRHAAGLGLDLGSLPLRLVSDPEFNLDRPGTVARVRKALADLGAAERPATFILESLTTNVVLDLTNLHDAVSVRAYIRRTLAALQADFPDLSSIVSHHLKKPQAGGANDLSTRVSGSVQIRAGLDCVIGLVPDGPEAFTVRTLKRSRSGARFDAFKVRILGDPDAPLTLKYDGTVDVSDSELMGASGAVLAFLKAAGGPRPLKAIVAGVTGFRDRAIQSACRRLSDGESPRLVRTGIKPAAYTYAPPKQTGLDLGGLD